MSSTLSVDDFPDRPTENDQPIFNEAAFLAGLWPSSKLELLELERSQLESTTTVYIPLLELDGSPPPESRPSSQTDELVASTAPLSCESMVASARETGGLATSPSLPLAGHHFSHSVSLPATSQLFIKGMDLNPLVKQSTLPRHWLEVVPPADRMTNTWQELGLRDLDAPIRTPPSCFMKLILEHYRNAILNRIGLNPLNEVLSDKLASMGTSLSSRNLYSTKRPIPDKRDLEAFLKPYFDRAGTFSVEISKEKVWEHGQWVWKMSRTTVDCNESEH